MKARLIFALVPVLFIVGVIPLFMTLPSEEEETVLSTGEGDLDFVGGSVLSLEEEAESASPLELPPATATDWPASTALDCPSIDLRLLVLSADGQESTLPAIREVLDFAGVPYSVYIATENPGGLTRDQLSDGCRGYYQGVILTSGDLSYSPDGESTRSALTEAEWSSLEDYEANFGIRRLAYYTYPTSEYGLQPLESVNTAESPIEARYTNAGEDVFGYANTDNPLTISNAFAYPAQPTDETTTPLLRDDRGNTLAAVAEYPDGRESLALTFDNSKNLVHSRVLGYGLLNWVTRGVFLGERHVYLSAQIDDLFLPNTIWAGAWADSTYRMTGDDLQAVIDWQQDTQSRATTEQLRLDMGFNAYGTTGVYDIAEDTLTPLAKEHQDQFKWINHTYKHLDLDEVGYSVALQEIQRNDEFAPSLGLGDYSEANLITPELSGLNNTQVLQAAFDAGVRYMVSDASRPQFTNPSPNAGRYHPDLPAILLIPRYPNNLFYDVSTPDEWVAEYNHTYRDVWGGDLTYEEILEKESDVLLGYLLRGDINPLMFHQSNLRAYDEGAHTLLADLLDLTFEKYDSYFNLPILSPTQDDLAQRLIDRMQYNDAGVTATIVPEQSAVTLTATEAATVPVTGLRTSEAEYYGGQYISRVSLSAGESITLPLQ